jgi:hypothetical protein
MDTDNKTYNVVEVLEGPHAGRVAVVPCRKPGFRLQLRKAQYRVCNVEFLFADGFACGLITAKRNSLRAGKAVTA